MFTFNIRTFNILQSSCSVKYTYLVGGGGGGGGGAGKGLTTFIYGDVRVMFLV